MNEKITCGFLLLFGITILISFSNVYAELYNPPVQPYLDPEDAELNWNPTYVYPFEYVIDGELLFSEPPQDIGPPAPIIVPLNPFYPSYFMNIGPEFQNTITATMTIIQGVS